MHPRPDWSGTPRNGTANSSMRETVGHELRVCERAAGELRGEAAHTGLDPAPRLSQRAESWQEGLCRAVLWAQRRPLKSGPMSARRGRAGL